MDNNFSKEQAKARIQHALTLRKKLDNTTDRHKKFEHSSVFHDDEPGKVWPVFNRDMQVYVSQFSVIFPDIRQRINEIVHEREQRGEKAHFLDLAGAASGESLGAHMTTSATLTGAKGLQAREGQRLVVGDLLSTKGLKALTDELDSSGVPISVCFLRPVGGVAKYEGNALAQRRLERVLAAVYERMVPGGHIYCDLGTLRDPLELRSFAGSARIELGRDKDPNVFRIVKPKTELNSKAL